MLRTLKNDEKRDQKPTKVTKIENLRVRKNEPQNAAKHKNCDIFKKFASQRCGRPLASAFYFASLAVLN